jgi:hypothetical protein
MSKHGRNGKSGMIARAVQKHDKTRVALRKVACGAVLIDGLPFSVSVESDGAPSNKGIIFTLSGESVENGELKIDMIDTAYPSGGGVKHIKRPAEYYEKKDGRHVYRAKFPEIKISQCADESLFQAFCAYTEEQFLASFGTQITFKFVPHYSGDGEPEVMINIYPAENPLDGSCTEWKNVTADRDFFEHGGLSKISEK